MMYSTQLQSISGASSATIIYNLLIDFLVRSLAETHRTVLRVAISVTPHLPGIVRTTVLASGGTSTVASGVDLTTGAFLQYASTSKGLHSTESAGLPKRSLAAASHCIG